MSRLLETVSWGRQPSGICVPVSGQVTLKTIATGNNRTGDTVVVDFDSMGRNYRHHHSTDT